MGLHAGQSPDERQQADSISHSTHCDQGSIFLPENWLIATPRALMSSTKTLESHQKDGSLKYEALSSVASLSNVCS